MKRFERHAFDRDPRDAFEHAEKMFELACAKLGDSPNPVTVLERVASNANSLAHFAGAIADKPRTTRALRLLAEANAALFELATHPGVAIEVRIEDASYRLLVPQPHRMAGPTEWLDGFAAGCAGRVAPALSVLVAVRRDVLDLSRLSAQWHEFLFAWVPALQALVRREPSAGALLANVLDDAARLTEETALRERYVAEIALALRLHEADPLRFNEALERALVAHRAYWTAPSTDELVDDRREHPHGFIALGPLGLACLAHDRGIAIEVESEYVPGWIVRKEW